MKFILSEQNKPVVYFIRDCTDGHEGDCFGIYTDLEKAKAFCQSLLPDLIENYNDPEIHIELNILEIECNECNINNPELDGRLVGAYVA